MKRWMAIILLICVFLAGCGGADDGMDRAIALRQRLVSGQGCSFDVEISADYGTEVHSFSLSCQADEAGDLTFQVTAPESIAGITGKISKEGGNLTFEEQALAFPLLADEQLSPVSAPWVLIHTLMGGYLSSATEEGDNLRLSIDDSYAEDALRLDIWLDSADVPVRAEILYDGRRILTMDVKNFVYQ